MHRFVVVIHHMKNVSDIVRAYGAKVSRVFVEQPQPMQVYHITTEKPEDEHLIRPLMR